MASHVNCDSQKNVVDLSYLRANEPRAVEDELIINSSMAKIRCDCGAEWLAAIKVKDKSCHD